MTATKPDSDLENDSEEQSTDVGTDAPVLVHEGAGKRAWSRALVFALLPLMIVGLASAAAALWWHDMTVRESATAQSESTKAAHDASLALLAYQPETVDAQLHAASALLTGSFKDSYTQLTNDVVIPGAKQKQIASVVSVSAVSSVSASPRHAVSLVFVDQTVTVGGAAPTATSSAIRVTVDKVEDRWMVSGFDPV